LSQRTRLTREFIAGLVDGDLTDPLISGDELQELARALDAESDSLLYADLPHERSNVLLENLKYLLGSLERGGKAALAKTMEIDPTTISRWLSGAYPPQGPALSKLVSHFGLPDGTDLKKDPVFLSVEPLAILERRKLLKDRIDAIEPSEFKALYPALKRLLEER
jgi:hypothetical protein